MGLSPAHLHGHSCMVNAIFTQNVISRQKLDTSFTDLLLANIRFKGKEEKKQGHSLGFVKEERLFPESRDQLRHSSLAPLPEENQVVFM